MAGTELAKAYVQIIPTTKGIKSEIGKELGEEVENAGDEAGKKGGENADVYKRQVDYPCRGRMERHLIRPVVLHPEW